VVYSDCAGVLDLFVRLRVSLDGLCMLEYGEQLNGPGVVATAELSADGVGVWLRCVPGHPGVRGNVKAYRAARRGAIGRLEVKTQEGW